MQDASPPPTRGRTAKRTASVAGNVTRQRGRYEAEILRLQRMMAGIEAERALAVLQRDSMLASTAWKITWPMRWLGSVLPSKLRWHGRRALKAIWWSLTPWRLSHRMRALDARKQAGSATVPLLRNEPAVVPDPAITLPDRGSDGDYANWIAAFEPDTANASGPSATAPISAGRLEAASPELSFLMLCVAGLDATAAEATLASLRAQTETGWELLVAAPSGAGAVARMATDPRVRHVAFDGQGIPHQGDRGAALQRLLQEARGRWVGVLDPGDVLAGDALETIGRTVLDLSGDAPDDTRALAGQAVILYGDEDEIGPDGRRRAPLFKPSWSPEMLQAFNYFGRLTVLSRVLALRAGGFVAGHGAGAEWNLNLRAADVADAAGGRIARITKVLCHRAAGGDRDRPDPASAAAAEHRTALRAFWAGRGIAGAHVETQPDGTQRSRWDIAEPPLVSVIIPSHNSPDMLRRCVEGILDRTAYRNVEIVLVENRSDDPEIWPLYEALERRGSVRVIRFDARFNYSAACNRGAEVARGSLLLFLNNDIEIVEPGWLGELVRVATLPGVGMAGTRLRYPDGTLQHAGVSVGIHLFGLMFHRGNETDWGVFGSANHTRNWLGVMGACQMLRREAFDCAGGFDEAYRIANSDVALSLHVHRLGWRTVYTPFATLVHHEGKTRGHSNPAEDMARSAREVRRLGLADDPYMHPGLSGHDPVPRLRAAGEPSPEEAFQGHAEFFLSEVAPAAPPFDPYDDGDAEDEADLPRDAILWPPQAPDGIRDKWSAARWVLDLLRGRPDLRTRFPRALSDGAGGAFATWIAGDAGSSLGLPTETRAQIAALLADDLAVRPRQVFFWHDHVRSLFPLGLLPAGCGEFAGWLLRHGADEGIRLEEIWWFILCCAEAPEAELVQTYRYTPAWQELHPFGLTIFGRDRLAAWIREFYNLRVDAGWLDPRRWPVNLSPAEQIRLAYAAHDRWRAAHPRPFQTAASAGALLDWLASAESGLAEEIRAWCAARRSDGTAAALATTGVNIIAHFCYPSGLRVSAEAMADAIEATGGGVSRRDMRTDVADDPHHAEFGGLETYDITVIHTQPEPYFSQSYQRSDLAPRAPRTYRIGYWYLGTGNRAGVLGREGPRGGRNLGRHRVRRGRVAPDDPPAGEDAVPRRAHRRLHPPPARSVRAARRRPFRLPVLVPYGQHHGAQESVRADPRLPRGIPPRRTGRSHPEDHLLGPPHGAIGRTAGGDPRRQHHADGPAAEAGGNPLADGILRRLCLAAPKRGARPDDGGGDAAGQTGDRHPLLGQPRLHG